LKAIAARARIRTNEERSSEADCAYGVRQSRSWRKRKTAVLALEEKKARWSPASARLRGHGILHGPEEVQHLPAGSRARRHQLRCWKANRIGIAAISKPSVNRSSLRNQLNQSEERGLRNRP